MRLARYQAGKRSNRNRVHPHGSETITVLCAGTGAGQFAGLVIGPRGSAMHHGPLVPHHHITQLPLVGIDVSWPGAERCQLGQQAFAFRLIVAVNAERMAGDIERLTTIGRVGPDRIPVLLRSFVEHG